MINMVGTFHNYNSLVNRHARTFNIYKKKVGVRDISTTRWNPQEWEIATTIQGAIWYVTNKDLQRYPDMELTTSNMRLTTTSDLLNGYTPDIKDKVEFDGNVYYIKQIIQQLHYGNYYIIFLEKVQNQV